MSLRALVSPVLWNSLNVKHFPKYVTIWHLNYYFMLSKYLFLVFLFAKVHKHNHGNFKTSQNAYETFRGNYHNFNLRYLFLKWDDRQMIYQHMLKDFHFYNIYLKIFNIHTEILIHLEYDNFSFALRVLNYCQVGK